MDIFTSIDKIGVTVLHRPPLSKQSITTFNPLKYYFLYRTTSLDEKDEIIQEENEEIRSLFILNLTFTFFKI